MSELSFINNEKISKNLVKIIQKSIQISQKNRLKNDLFFS